MTKQQILKLEPGQLVSWHEPGTTDHGKRGKVVYAGPDGNRSIQWFDGERVPIRDWSLTNLARHLMKARE